MQILKLKWFSAQNRIVLSVSAFVFVKMSAQWFAEAQGRWLDDYLAYYEKDHNLILLKSRLSTLKFSPEFLNKIIAEKEQEQQLLIDSVPKGERFNFQMGKKK